LQKISTEDLLFGNSFGGIPSQFRELVKDIINSTESVETTENTKMWIAFGRWLGFKNPITKRKVRRHLKSKWIKLQHKNVGVSENLKNKEKQ